MTCTPIYEGVSCATKVVSNHLANVSPDGPTIPAVTSGLAVTGAQIAALVLIAVLLIVVGCLSVSISRLQHRRPVEASLPRKVTSREEWRK